MITKHKQRKALKRRKQLLKQKGNAGLLGYMGKRNLPRKTVRAFRFRDIFAFIRRIVSTVFRRNWFTKRNVKKDQLHQRNKVVQKAILPAKRHMGNKKPGGWGTW